MPVWRACHDFLLRQTAFKNGRRDGMPSAEATTANALQTAKLMKTVNFQNSKANIQISWQLASFTVIIKVAYLAVVLRTYSSMLSMSGLIVEIIVAKPAAYRKLKVRHLILVTSSTLNNLPWSNTVCGFFVCHLMGKFMLILKNCFSFINYFFLLTKLTCLCVNKKMTPWLKCNQNLNSKLKMSSFEVQKQFLFKLPMRDQV